MREASRGTPCNAARYRRRKRGKVCAEKEAGVVTALYKTVGGPLPGVIGC